MTVRSLNLSGENPMGQSSFIPPIVTKYINRVHDLAHEGKTGLECEYCGEEIYHDLPNFCPKCGAPARFVIGWLMGIPVFEPMDFVEITRWCPYLATIGKIK